MTSFTGTEAVDLSYSLMISPYGIDPMPDFSIFLFRLASVCMFFGLVDLLTFRTGREKSTLTN